MADRQETTALAAAGVTVVLWASAFVSIRSAGEAYSPGAMALGRLAVAAVLLVALGLVRADRVAGPRRLARDPDLRGALVRRLHGAAQLG